MDNLTIEIRSRVMAATKARGNKSTELKLKDALRHSKVKGWRRHLSLPGKPDFAFPKRKLAVFVDGCFWHGCPQHCRMPQDNNDYWRQKISRNRLRDAEATSSLEKKGWRVLRLWEHELKTDAGLCIRKIQENLI